MGLKQKFLEFFGEEVDDDTTVENEKVEEEVVTKQQPKQQAKTYSHVEFDHPEEKEKKGINIFGGGKKEEIGKMKVSYVSIIAHLSKVTDKVLTSIPNGVGYEDIDTSLEEEKDGSKLL